MVKEVNSTNMENPDAVLLRRRHGLLVLGLFVSILLLWNGVCDLLFGYSPTLSGSEYYSPAVWEVMRTAGNRQHWMVMLAQTAGWLYPFYALFAAEVFRHVIIFAMVFYLSLQLAAKYLDDVFELNRVDVAEKYIIQAAFASKYDTITIKEGRIASDNNDSPVALIGGPGSVRVYLDNAAVFEAIDGKPRILGPTQKPAILDRFERLRKGVLLRDHIVTEMSVTERTRDGITVQADGGRTKYSIFRNHQKSSLERPYPFDPNAVETQVYNQVKAARFTGHYPPPKPAPDKSDEPLKLSEGFIKGQLARFISESTLSEFLAFADSNQQKDADSEIEFTPRDIITQRMYNSIDEQAKKERGAELYWVDIGTWVLPADASEIPQQHREAWEISLKNLAKGNEEAYEKSFKEAKSKALAELMQEIILLFQLHRNTQTPQKLIDELTIANPARAFAISRDSG